MTCFLAQFAPDTPCDGRLIAAHLIPRQVIKRERGTAARAWMRGTASEAQVRLLERTASEWIEDPRSWVPACGGPMGNLAHHGMLDSARTLRIPRECLPAGLEQFAEELGLTYWLEREYGPLEAAA